MQGEKRDSLNPGDPIVIEIVQRLARLEARVDDLEKQLEDIKGKVWWLITGVILSILIQILLRLIP